MTDDGHASSATRSASGRLREEEDAGRLLVEAVDEREIRPEALTERPEEAVRPVDGDAGGLVDREVGLRAGRRREDLHALNLRADPMTARLPAMFAAIPITIGVWWNRIP